MCFTVQLSMFVAVSDSFDILSCCFDFVKNFFDFFESCYFSTLFSFSSHIISSFVWLVKNFFHLFYLFEKFLYLSDNLILFLHFAHIIVCLSQTQLDYDIIIHQYLSTLFLFFYFIIFINPQTESWISFLPYLARPFHDNTEIKKVSPSSKKQ